MSPVVVAGVIALVVVVTVVGVQVRRLVAAVERLDRTLADDRHAHERRLATIGDQLRDLAERDDWRHEGALDWARPTPEPDRAHPSAPRIKAAGLATGASVAVRRLRRGA